MLEALGAEARERIWPPKSGTGCQVAAWRVVAAPRRATQNETRVDRKDRVMIDSRTPSPGSGPAGLGRAVLVLTRAFAWTAAIDSFTVGASFDRPRRLWSHERADDEGRVRVFAFVVEIVAVAIVAELLAA